jgi:hypothetical protein
MGSRVCEAEEDLVLVEASLSVRHRRYNLASALIR